MRYALLDHDCPPGYREGPHWDLLVERPGMSDVERRLAAWSLLALPPTWRERLSNAAPDRSPLASGLAEAGMVQATPLTDHRAHYLDYEGPIGGGRGVVTRVAAGQVAWLEAASAGDVRLRLTDGPLAGEVELRSDASVVVLRVS
ncbi:hypothetical protein Mal64_11740 [Pseudobythopirellula maris]|uniref:Uncharacterized protein n=1 Tax=Pseudobythopirellula maris TaxID=2527991 RepID=A0A5C5ZUW7_9BACT|nr:hypothetical protein [Pseudobythopirellula maris]TWT90777.1 hypothetical protein Mal64_11740 [Pseudobythopirellula maris]